MPKCWLPQLAGRAGGRRPQEGCTPARLGPRAGVPGARAESLGLFPMDRIHFGRELLWERLGACGRRDTSQGEGQPCAAAAGARHSVVTGRQQEPETNS